MYLSVYCVLTPGRMGTGGAWDQCGSSGAWRGCWGQATPCRKTYRGRLLSFLRSFLQLIKWVWLSDMMSDIASKNIVMSYLPLCTNATDAVRGKQDTWRLYRAGQLGQSPGPQGQPGPTQLSAGSGQSPWPGPRHTSHTLNTHNTGILASTFLH